MKKYRSFFSPLVVMVIIAGSFQYEAKGQANGLWSGTVTEHSQVTGAPGIQAESRVTINYKNNVGTGTYSKNDLLTIDGKIMGRTNCTGTGTIGFAELSIDNANKTYTIQTSALIYTCTYLRDSPDSGECYITIDNEPWDENPRVLKGSKFQENDVAGGKLTTLTTWNLVKESDVDLIVTPQKYDTWLPIPGRNEQTPGPEMMNVTLKLQDRNGGPASEKAKSFELRLSNTSKEKGITINMPLEPATQQLPDLRFQPQQGAIITEEGQLMILYCPAGCLTADFKIACYDGGAWTTLTAVAVLETDSIKGSLLEPGGEKDILIPKREPGAKIGSFWLNAHGGSSDGYDDEESDDNTNNGDGLSTYEEYRGVISKGQHLRLDPEKKELGVRGTAGNLALFGQGFNWFENASKIKVIRFLEDEIDENHRRINKNSGHAHVFDQCVLKFVIENLPEGVVGRAYNYGGPRTTDRVAIDWPQMQTIYRVLVSEARPATLKYSLLELLANTVAHEMAHGVNVNHHGREPSEPDPQVARDNSYPPYRIFDSNGRLLFESNGQPNSNRSFSLAAIGTRGSQQSGDLSCMTAYNPYHNWAFTVGADGASIFNAVPLLPMGRGFCKDARGTGINAGILYFGDASRGGNCLGHLDLK